MERVYIDLFRDFIPQLEVTKKQCRELRSGMLGERCTMQDGMLLEALRMADNACFEVINILDSWHNIKPKETNV